MHKAVREALVNCLANADYYMPQGVVIKKDVTTLIIENPGSIRTGKKQMLKGGISDPRNKNLMKMFNLLGIGERAGSGIPDIYQVWEDQGWEMPVVEESYNPDRTRLSLYFAEKISEQNKRTKQANKTSEQNKRTKQANKGNGQNKRRKKEESYSLIRAYLAQNGLSRTNDIADYLGLSPARTRAILGEMTGIEYEGTTNNRKYKLLNN